MAEDPATVVQARAAMGSKLARLRAAAGYTQENFAPRTFYGRSSIANIETGRQSAPRDFWALCDKILQTGGLLAEEHDRLARMRHQVQISLEQSAHPRPGPQAMAIFGSKGIEILPTATGALVGELVDPLADEPERVAVLSSRQLTDTEYIAHWAQMLSVLAAAGNAVGGRGLIDIVSTEISVISHYAASAIGQSAAGFRLAKARWMEFGSWIADNQGQKALATSWLQQANMLASEANDPVLAAYLVMRRAQRAHDEGQPRVSLDLIEQVVPSQLPPRIGGLLATRAAQAHATLLDGPAARRWVKHALHLIGRDVASDVADVELASHSTPQYVLAHEGTCLLALGEPNGAVSILDAVLRGWPPSHRLDEGLFRAHFALAQAMTGAYDEAVDEAKRALALGVETGSHRTLRVIRQVLDRDLHGAVGHEDLVDRWTAVTSPRGS